MKRLFVCTLMVVAMFTTFGLLGGCSAPSPPTPSPTVKPEAPKPVVPAKPVEPAKSVAPAPASAPATATPSAAPNWENLLPGQQSQQQVLGVEGEGEHS